MKRLYKRVVRAVKKIGGTTKKKASRGSSTSRKKAVKKKKIVKKVAKKTTKRAPQKKTSQKVVRTKRTTAKKRVVKKISTKAAPKVKKTLTQKGSHVISPSIISVKPLQVLNENGKVIGKLPKLSSQQLVEMYKLMVLSRVHDERALKLQRQGRIGTYASIKGQEGTQIGSAYALQENDWLVPTFRENASCITKGMPMKALYQYWGGDERGHAYKEAQTILPISIPISTQVPHAVGIAMGLRYRGEKSAVLVHMGDGGTSEGDFHEGLNFGGVYNAPVVFLTTNNHWAISLPRSGQTASSTLAQKALAYGFEGVVVDGNDPLAVYSVVSWALEKARNGGGPTLVECNTFRMGDHTTADDSSIYMDKKELASWEKKDPLDRLRKYLMSKKLWSSAKEKKLQTDVAAQVADVVKAYEEAPLPNPKDMFKFTFAEMPEQLVEQQQMLLDVALKITDARVIEKIEGGFP